MRLLLVEDSHRLRRSIGVRLANSGHALDRTRDGDAAWCHLEVGGYDLVVLDLTTPEPDGFELLQRLRARGDTTYVLMLSAKDRVEDRVRGLDTGADDFLVRPFSFDELLARIRAVTRRRRDDGCGAGTRLEAGDVRIDTATREVLVGDAPLALTPNQYALLELLVRRRGQVFPADGLIERLYAAERNVTRNAIEAHVSALRRKLEAAGVSRLIATRRGFGYVIPP